MRKFQGRLQESLYCNYCPPPPKKPPPQLTDSSLNFLTTEINFVRKQKKHLVSKGSSDWIFIVAHIFLYFISFHLLLCVLKRSILSEELQQKGFLLRRSGPPEQRFCSSQKHRQLSVWYEDDSGIDMTQRGCNVFGTQVFYGVNIQNLWFQSAQTGSSATLIIFSWSRWVNSSTLMQTEIQKKQNKKRKKSKHTVSSRVCLRDVRSKCTLQPEPCKNSPTISHSVDQSARPINRIWINKYK